MEKPKILLIEDEEDIAALIQLQAEISEYELIIETNGNSGLLAVAREKPDIIILDLMLPGLSGLKVCQKIKSDPMFQRIPIIIISAKSEEHDVIRGLEIGADDYVTKPFSPKILFSKILAVLRRYSQVVASPQKITFGAFTLEPERYLLFKKDKQITLTLSEFGILCRLVTNRGKVLTRNQLLDDIHTSDSFIVDRNIDVHIASLRKKLGPGFHWIETVRSVGYRFKEKDED